MKKDKTLLVLAAGMGSRFGGLKQIEPVGPNNEFIIDYSVKDAIIAGFNKPAGFPHQMQTGPVPFRFPALPETWFPR